MPFSIQTTQQYVPSAYQKLYMKIDGRLQTELENLSIDFEDGGATASTIVKDFAGRFQGAAMCRVTGKGIVPYILTDASGGGGVGMNSAGIVTGKGIQLTQTMLSGQNQNANLPVVFLVNIGQPAAQKIILPGFIIKFTIDYAKGGQASFNFSAETSFNTFQG